ncbi:glycoside hydrolase family 88 protein [Paenibacillus mendelii]|nr:glycoside hydrolase family 88 protein [Paenibacillus mendelii]
MRSKEQIEQAASSVYAYMIRNHDGNWGMDLNQWDWVPGVGINAIHSYGVSSEREDVKQFVAAWLERNGRKAERVKVINAMAPFVIFPDMFRLTGDDGYKQTAVRIADWMIHEAPRTRERAFEHTVTENASFPEQVWADTIFMAVLFLARTARLTERTDYAEEAVNQLLVHMRLLQDPATGILFHGWNCGTGNHMSGARWTRGNGWVVIGMPEILGELNGLVELPDELFERYRKLADGLLHYQTADGLWHTVMDQPYFYQETSGSAAIACGLRKAVRSGLLDASYRMAAERGLEGVMRKIAYNGEVTGVSSGTPVKDTIDDYQGIPLIPTLYGQGLTLMLLSEWLRDS